MRSCFFSDEDGFYRRVKTIISIQPAQGAPNAATRSVMVKKCISKVRKIAEHRLDVLTIRTLKSDIKGLSIMSSIDLLRVLFHNRVLRLKIETAKLGRVRKVKLH